jgi:hypothetical protein
MGETMIVDWSHNPGLIYVYFVHAGLYRPSLVQQIYILLLIVELARGGGDPWHTT